jgi:hypothetical protein
MIYIIMALTATITTILWVSGVSYMHEEYPDYEGEDLLEEDKQTDQDGKIQKDN